MHAKANNKWLNELWRIVWENWLFLRAAITGCQWANGWRLLFEWNWNASRLRLKARNASPLDGNLQYEWWNFQIIEIENWKGKSQRGHTDDEFCPKSFSGQHPDLREFANMELCVYTSYIVDFVAWTQQNSFIALNMKTRSNMRNKAMFRVRMLPLCMHLPTRSHALLHVSLKGKQCWSRYSQYWNIMNCSSSSR